MKEKSFDMAMANGSYIRQQHKSFVIEKGYWMKFVGKIMSYGPSERDRIAHVIIMFLINWKYVLEWGSWSETGQCDSYYISISDWGGATPNECCKRRDRKKNEWN